jgi:hypothetical protein
MALEIYRLMASMLSDGDLVVITGRRKPHKAPVSDECFPLLAYVKHDESDGSLLGAVPRSTLGLSFLLSTSPRDKGYTWRLPRMEDAKLFETTKLTPFDKDTPSL